MSALRPMRGYTLLEMIVAIGLFSTVMLIATGAYLALINIDRESRATSQLITNLSFAIDSMTRTIRTGGSYCGSGLTPSCSSSRFTFRDTDGRTISYSISGGSILQSVNGATAVAITDPAINIPSTGLRFYVRGQAAGDDTQPQVTFTVRGSLTDGEGQVTDFAIQSSATQRLIDS